MKVDFYDVARLHQPLRSELALATARVVRSGQYILGDELALFERNFAAYCGTDHCAGVGNGMDAIYLALLALGIGPGDKVLVAANVCIAAPLAISRTGAAPVLIDVCAGSRNLDPDRLRRSLSAGVKAILVIHQYGEVACMAAINDFARRHGLFVIEDASHAHGARAGERMAGSLGDIGCFSFYPSKNLGALGDGGAVLTGDRSLDQRIRRLRNYGMQARDEPVDVGVNSRLDDIQAASLNAKLPFLDHWIGRRNEIAGRYMSELNGLPGLDLPSPGPYGQSAWHLFVVCHPERDGFRERLSCRGIGTGIHYPYAVHQTLPYASVATDPAGLAISEGLAARCFSLPIGPYLEEAEVEYVIREVKSVAMDLAKK